MIKRRLAAYGLVMSMTVALGGCNGSAQQDTLSSVSTKDQTEVEAEKTTEMTTTEETTTETIAETVAETESFTDYYSAVDVRTDYISEEYMEKATSLNKYADYAKVADVMKKAEAGEKVTICCLGGSITQGTISSGGKDAEVKDTVGRKCYADIVFEWWKTAYPDTEIECVNAGIGATGSYIGLHRLQKDVLSYNPDLVVVEFSVNDAGVSQNRTTYENLCRNILSSENSPAVVCLFMGMPGGGSAQTSHQDTALYYNLPNVSYNDMMVKYIADGVYTADELAGDGVHPTVLGHALTGELLWKLFNDISAHKDGLEAASEFDNTKDYLSKDKFKECYIADSSIITPDDYGSFEDTNKFSVFPNDWTSSEGEGGMTFTLSFKNLGVMYYKITNGKGAKYDIYIDGEKVTSINSDFSGGWGNYAESVEVYSSDEEAEHTVSFKKSEDSSGEEFTVLGLMVSK